MVDGYGTQTGVMTEVANRLESINGELQGRLQSLRGRVEPLVAEWQGRGSTAFQGTMATWSTDAKRINDALLGIAGRVRAGGVQYQATEDDMSRLLNVLGDGGGAGGGAPTAPSAGTISSALDGR